MQYGPIILLSPGRSGSTLAQRLINSVKDWYMFGEHSGAFKHLVEFRDSLDERSAEQRKYGDMIVQRTEAFLGKWSAWALPFDADDVNPALGRMLRELYTKRLPDRCLWGFKEIRYTAREALVFSELFENACIIVLRRDFTDYCKSWCMANFRERAPSPWHARQLVLSYLGFYEQLQVASAIAEKPFRSISYEHICSDPQSLIDLIAAEFDWPITPEDRDNVFSTSRRIVDYISEEAKLSEGPAFVEFVTYATGLYRRACEQRVAS
jgi:hypothetical protein